MTRKTNHLVIIDPQNDFCDLSQWPTAEKGPALPVAGAYADMQRVAHLIDAAREALAEITVTLDSHHWLDIAHPGFWKTAEGDTVAPFTQILAQDVRAGRYLPRMPGAAERTLTYLDALEHAGRYAHMVWPVHCEIGSWGHNVVDEVRAAYNRWEDQSLTQVNKIIKGTNPWTEHYSAIAAEVPDPHDPDTQTNRTVLDRLRLADRIYITGEAGSHCVKATTEHIVRDLGSNATKLVIVTDCMSAVAGFEANFAQFQSDMRAAGARLATSAEVIEELVAQRG